MTCNYDVGEHDYTKQGLPLKFEVISRQPLTDIQVKSLKNHGCAILNFIIAVASTQEAGSTISANIGCKKCKELIALKIVVPSF